MSLKDQIQSDFKEAFKAKEELRLSTLKLLNAAIKNAEIEKRTKLSKLGESDLQEKSQLTDDEVIQVINREVKKRKDAIELYEKGGRQELAKKEKVELDILLSYMPEQLTEEEIRKLAKEAIEKSGASDIKEIGKVMALLMPQVKGKADGSLVNKIIKELLG